MARYGILFSGSAVIAIALWFAATEAGRNAPRSTDTRVSDAMSDAMTVGQPSSVSPSRGPFLEWWESGREKGDTLLTLSHPAFVVAIQDIILSAERPPTDSLGDTRSLWCLRLRAAEHGDIVKYTMFTNGRLMEIPWSPERSHIVKVNERCLRNLIEAMARYERCWKEDATE